jgi:hypothetical protein
MGLLMEEAEISVANLTPNELNHGRVSHFVHKNNYIVDDNTPSNGSYTFT